MALVRDHSVPGNEFSRRELLKRLAAGVVAAPAILRGRYPLFRPADARFPVEYSARAIKLVQESVVIDLLNQFRFADFAEKPPKSQLWLSKPRSMTSADWEVYRTSGYSVICLGHAPRDYADGLRFFAEWNGFVAEYPEWFARVDDARDFEAVKKAGKVGIMITFQNSDHFRSPDDVDQFYSLGQRLSQLTYNYQNRIGSGFLEERDGGLTVFGKSIVQRMEQVGMAGRRLALRRSHHARRPRHRQAPRRHLACECARAHARPCALQDR
jgi:membrane dipeptidase